MEHGIIKKPLLRMLRSLKNILFIISPVLIVLKTKDGISANKIDFKRKRDKCIIMGNGPSLREDLPAILEEKEQADFFCVNSFPLAEEFFKIKPEHLFLTDTAWWRPDPSPEIKSNRDEVYDALRKVDWNIQLFTTHNADYRYMQNSIENEHIEVIKLRTAGIHRILDEKAFKYYDTGYFAPPLDNVLLTSIYTAIKAGYRKIEIYGADLSYLFQINVDQETNEIFIEEEHFNKKSDREVLKKDAGIDSEPATMSDFLSLQASVLKSHEILNEYARSKGVKIVNKSSFSIIDAYSRE